MNISEGVTHRDTAHRTVPVLSQGILHILLQVIDHELRAARMSAARVAATISCYVPIALVAIAVKLSPSSLVSSCVEDRVVSRPMLA